MDEDTKYQIAWWDGQVQPPDVAGWKYMPSEVYTLLTGDESEIVKGRALDQLARIRKLYPGIKFSIQRITKEIVAQVQ